MTVYPRVTCFRVGHVGHVPRQVPGLHWSELQLVSGGGEDFGRLALSTELEDMAGFIKPGGN